MKNILLMLALLLCPAVASAQVVVSFGWSAPPPLIEISPGVQIVENSGDEVFFTGGHYWVERDHHWYWARDHHEHWEMAPGPAPLFLREHRRGQYAHWRHEEHHEARHEQHEARHEQKHEQHEQKREQHEQKHEQHEHEQKHDQGKHHGEGEHKDHN